MWVLYAMNLAVISIISLANNRGANFRFSSHLGCLQNDLWPAAPEMKIYHALEMVMGEVRKLTKLLVIAQFEHDEHAEQIHYW